MDPLTVLRRLALVAIACAFVPAGGAVAAQSDSRVAALELTASSRPLVALKGRSGVRSAKNALALVRLDPSTFRVRPGRVLLGDRNSAWSFSPDGSTVVLADSTLFGWLRFVDVVRMRWSATCA